MTILIYFLTAALSVIAAKIDAAPSIDDFRQIFHTPQSRNNYDKLEILERSNFGEVDQQTGLNNAETLPKSYSNAQILLRIGDSNEKKKFSPSGSTPYCYPYFPPPCWCCQPVFYPYYYPMPAPSSQPQPGGATAPKTVQLTNDQIEDDINRKLVEKVVELSQNVKEIPVDLSQARPIRPKCEKELNESLKLYVPKDANQQPKMMVSYPVYNRPQEEGNISNEGPIRFPTYTEYGDGKKEAIKNQNYPFIPSFDGKAIIDDDGCPECRRKYKGELNEFIRS